MMEIGKLFKMTFKTKLYLKMYYFFDRIGKIGQWFITRCDYEEDSTSLVQWWEYLDWSRMKESFYQLPVSLQKKIKKKGYWSKGKGRFEKMEEET
jgi:hypothetical protein